MTNCTKKQSKCERKAEPVNIYANSTTLRNVNYVLLCIFKSKKGHTMKIVKDKGKNKRTQAKGRGAIKARDNRKCQ